MAEISVPPAHVLLAKCVQQMVLDGEEPHQPYICRDDSTDHEDVSVPKSQLPVIDLTHLSSVELSIAEEEAVKLKTALCSWGCFLAVGHGIPKPFLDETRQLAMEFFEQPMDEKIKYAKGVDEFEGYGADPVPAEGQSLDWSDRLFLNIYPEDQREPKLWPENPKSFREVLEDYTIEMRKLTEIISKAMAKSLNLEQNCFLHQFGEKALLQARFNYYSRCQRPDLVLGLKAHSDGSGYTIIMQNDVEGLQVLKDKNWITVPAISDDFLILMGNQMEIMTNGIFKSPVHRVLTHTDRERLSIAVFYTPEPDKEIGPEEGLINAETPRIFKKVKNYASIHWEYYQQGKGALHAVAV